MSNNVVNLKTVWEYKKIDHSKKNENHLLIQLKAKEKTSSDKRKPAAIEAVVDCSGSMGGYKIDYVKKTLLVLVDNLTEDDYLGVVGYGSSVWQIAPPTKCDSMGKETLKNLIRNNTNILGCTNLSGGFIEGFNALKNMDIDSKDRLNRVLLLTDGLANEGISDHSGLCKLVKNTCGDEDCNISLSTFGYGNDHDPEVLKDMAKQGGGNFHYISDPDQAPKALGLEIGGLLSVVAQGIKINLDLNDNVELLNVLNDFDVETTNNITTISIDDIYSEEEKNIVVKFKLPSMSKSVAARPEKKVLDIDIKYFNVDSSKSEESKESIKVSYVKASDADTIPNELVEKNIIILESATLQENAVKEADNGNYEKAKSILKRAKEGIEKCRSFAKDKILQGIAKDIENAIPNYDFGFYNAGIKSMALAGASSAKFCRSVGGGGTMSMNYSNSLMDSFCDSLEAGVDNYNDDLTGQNPNPFPTFIGTPDIDPSAYSNTYTSLNPKHNKDDKDGDKSKGYNKKRVNR